MYAIIGGSGLSSLPDMQVEHQAVIQTPYGLSAPLSLGPWSSKQGDAFYFLPRHGPEHRIPPHKINYRANVWALHSKGVTHVIAVAAVGSIDPALKPGDLVLPDQLIDYTTGRLQTFFEDDFTAARHIDFTWPYDQALRDQLRHTACQSGVSLHASGCYAVTQGPRLETAAEIRKLARDGATLVGMTGMPEAALARELGLAYCCCAIVVNPAAGISAEAITLDAIYAAMDRGKHQLMKLLLQVV